MNEAFRLITNNPDIPLIAVHKAKYFADKDEELSMGPGGFVQGKFIFLKKEDVFLHDLKSA